MTGTNNRTNDTTARGLELLLSLLATDDGETGHRYELLRLKTLRFFQWKGAADADELTDETLVRVGRKLGEGAPVGKGEIGPYVRGVARIVFLESLRNEERDRALRQAAPPPVVSVPDQETDLRLDCLEAGLEELEPDERNLLIRYYSDTGDGKIAERKSLATSLGISLTALRIRAYRLREKLAALVHRCIEHGPS